jgi:V/A-type H+-transporting ATPase subunit D
VSAVPALRRLPPGRAGRLWLHRRLAVARRAATLLDQKLHILRHEEDRLVLRAQRTGSEWEQHCREAETWLLRAALLGGQRALRHAGDPPPAEVTVTWASTMGVHHPDTGSCAVPRQDPAAPTPGGAALVEAVTAYERALEAAVHHAVAEGARSAVSAETAATRRRLRSVEQRWLPRLEECLAALHLELSESERAEDVRLRLSVGLGARNGDLQ